jgi:predicted Rossmann fold nucleotide-binding protein DprA/Smf involved in DNA uptake
MDFGDRDVRVAIVGSRRCLDRAAVEACVASLPVGTIVVSGGCRGPDSWAAIAAASRGLEVVVHSADLHGVRSRGEATRRFYDRNQAVVDNSDRVVAFPAPDHKGGTEDTIRRALKAGKLVELR